MLLSAVPRQGPKPHPKYDVWMRTRKSLCCRRGKYLSMASCGYPYFVGGVFNDPNQLIGNPTGVLRDSTYFSNVKEIKALTSSEAYAIDRENKKVKVRNVRTGDEFEQAYDKLILATGANPIMPQLPGIELEGVRTLQSMEDAFYLKKLVQDKEVSKAVIVGGGLIGIETCEALQLGGASITVVEMFDQVLSFSRLGDGEAG